jgi:hypothetical protein
MSDIPALSLPNLPVPSNVTEISAEARKLIGTEIERQAHRDKIFWDVSLAVLPGNQGLQPVGVLYVGAPNPLIGQGPLMAVQIIPNPLAMLDPEHVIRIVMGALEQIHLTRSEVLKTGATYGPGGAG